MPQSLDAIYYFIPFFIIATFGFFYTKKADLKPHSRIKLFASVGLLYLESAFTFGMAYIDKKVFSAMTLVAVAIWFILVFFISNSWIDKKYYKYKKNKTQVD